MLWYICFCPFHWLIICVSSPVPCLFSHSPKNILHVQTPVFSYSYPFQYPTPLIDVSFHPQGPQGARHRVGLCGYLCVWEHSGVSCGTRGSGYACVLFQHLEWDCGPGSSCLQVSATGNGDWGQLLSRLNTWAQVPGGSTLYISIYLYISFLLVDFCPAHPDRRAGWGHWYCVCVSALSVWLWSVQLAMYICAVYV